jgi:hypothetical protein
MAKWLKDLYNEYLQEELEEDLSGIKSPVEIGGIYFGSLKTLNADKPNKPLYFLVLRKMDDNLYEVLKMSDWHHFATNTEIFVELPTITLIAEIPNNFYLTSEEIAKFTLIDRIDNETLSKIKKFRRGENVDVKRGYTPMSRHVNLGEDYEDIRDVFKREEFNQIKEYHLRIFELLMSDE